MRALVARGLRPRTPGSGLFTRGLRPRSPGSGLFLTVLVAALALAGDAAARPPSYTMRAGFQTGLANVPDEDRKEECLDLACHEKGGTLVAQGASTHDGVALALRIREYRHHRDQSAAQLEDVAKKIVQKGVDDRELRLVAGKISLERGSAGRAPGEISLERGSAGRAPGENSLERGSGGRAPGETSDRPALEQWSVVNPCERELGGRVLLSLPDKIVEVEAVAKTKADGSDVPKAVAQISAVLHGARVRRAGDVTVDPAADTPPPSEIAEALKKGCL